VAESLTEVAEKRNSQDNVAVVVVDLRGAQGWSSAAAKPKGGLLGGLFGQR
jgi:serine/threonine protein phosphatase PrpC